MVGYSLAPCFMMQAAIHHTMASFLERLKSSVSMRPVEKTVTLPNGDVLSFYTTPITLAERAKARKAAKPDDTTDFALQLFALKATDEVGNKLVSQGDLLSMRNSLPSDLVESILLPLLENGSEDDADMKSTEAGASEGQRTSARAKAVSGAGKDAK